MASVWGKAWGLSWGNSWGSVGQAPIIKKGSNWKSRLKREEDEIVLLAMAYLTIERECRC